jgi:hypothetical protein
MILPESIGYSIFNSSSCQPGSVCSNPFVNRELVALDRFKSHASDNGKSHKDVANALVFLGMVNDVPTRSNFFIVTILVNPRIQPFLQRLVWRYVQIYLQEPEI